MFMDGHKIEISSFSRSAWCDMRVNAVSVVCKNILRFMMIPLCALRKWNKSTESPDLMLCWYT